MISATPATYFLCNDCLDRKPSIIWEGGVPAVISFPLLRPSEASE